MLEQFQARYPTGSLISELLTIYQGKFVVQVWVQIDGVTRATGLAAAETPEEAEDKARSRAIALLAIDSPLPSAMPMAERMPKAFVPEPERQTIAPAQAGHELNYQAHAQFTPQAPLSPPQVQAKDLLPPIESESAMLATISPNISPKNKSKRSLTSTSPGDEEEVFGDFGKISEPKTEIGTTAMGSKLTPISPGYEPEIGFESEIPINVSDTIDLSDDLITISVKLEESGWKPNTEREYLEQTYGKSSRHELTPEQVREFRRYLELFSQTTQITKELRELKWNNELGRRYLGQTYNRKLRQELNYQQLQEFLEFLKSERDRLRTK